MISKPLARFSPDLPGKFLYGTAKGHSSHDVSFLRSKISLVDGVKDK